MKTVRLLQTDADAVGSDRVGERFKIVSVLGKSLRRIIVFACCRSNRLIQKRCLNDVDSVGEWKITRRFEFDSNCFIPGV